MLVVRVELWDGVGPVSGVVNISAARRSRTSAVWRTRVTPWPPILYEQGEVIQVGRIRNQSRQGGWVLSLGKACRRRSELVRTPHDSASSGRDHGLARTQRTLSLAHPVRITPPTFHGSARRQSYCLGNGLHTCHTRLVHSASRSRSSSDKTVQARGQPPEPAPFGVAQVRGRSIAPADRRPDRRNAPPRCGHPRTRTRTTSWIRCRSRPIR